MKKRYFLRGEEDQDHRLIGKSLGSNDMSNEEKLHPDMKVEDGTYAIWDADGMSLQDIRSFVRGAKKQNGIVHVYRQVFDGDILKFNPFKKHKRKEVKASNNSSHHKAAVERLQELKMRKMRQTVH